MKFDLPMLLLLVSGVCPDLDVDQAEHEEVTDAEPMTFFSGYVRHFRRSYFLGDNGEYFAVAYEDQEFNQQVSALLRQHDTKFETVCFRVDFLGSIGGDAGDLVNRAIRIRKGLRLESIDCPQQ